MSQTNKSPKQRVNSRIWWTAVQGCKFLAFSSDCICITTFCCSKQARLLMLDFIMICPLIALRVSPSTAVYYRVWVHVTSSDPQMQNKRAGNNARPSFGELFRVRRVSANEGFHCTYTDIYFSQLKIEVWTLFVVFRFAKDGISAISKPFILNCHSGYTLFR